MTPRFGLLPKAITLVPLAALSVVGAVEVARTPTGDVSATVGRTSDQVASSTPTPAAPARPPASALVVPSAGQAPASVSKQARRTGSQGVVTAAALAAPTIPSIALAAYQRAATVIDTADASCHLDWSLIAAIGRVESDHGSHAGSRLDAAGHATPGIVGPRLNGRNRTMRVPDTDGGLLDGDARFDHAVGPMQFLPSTWATVGVDADGDGQRDPQDIDDAALAAGVYLCSGPEDLSTVAGRQAALLRYNHSASYVATVLHVAGAYQAGAGVDAAVPAFLATRTVTAALPVAGAADPAVAEAAVSTRHRRHRHHADPAVATALAGHPHAASAVAGHGATSAPPPLGQPAGTPPPSGQPDPSEPPATDPPTTGQPGTTPPPVVAATTEELTDLCTEQVEKTFPDATDAAHDQAIDLCVKGLDGKTLADAKDAVEDLVADLPDQVDGLVPPATPTADPTPTDPGTGGPTPADPSAPASQG